MPATTWLKWFEHMRWETTVGRDALDLSALFHEGRRFVVRAQKLEIIEGSLAHGAPLSFETWVGRVGRTSLDIGHLARRARDGSEVARASVVVVHLDAALAPAPIPDSIRALVREGPSARACALADARPPSAWSMPLSVRPSDVDMLQHVNHAAYAAYFDDARHAAIEAGAYEPRRRAAHPLHALCIEYAREARLGDSLRVHTWPIQKEPTAFAFELCRGEGELLARARLDVVPVA